MGSKAEPEPDTPGGPDTSGPDDDPPVLYSLQHAIQDFALVFAGTTAVYLVLVFTNSVQALLAWAETYPRLQVNAVFLYGILLSVGFGIAILRRWIQLSEVSRRQERIRQELAEKADALEQSNRELERFAYAASHDLREPLRMIHSYLGLLERRVDPDTLDDEAQHFLGEARNASNRMDRMVRGILKYAQMDPHTHSSEPTDADRALTHALEGLSHELGTRDVTVDRQPLPMVVARRDELALVFKHLLQNALAHGGGSLERIEIRGHVDGDQACIQVRDDGSGFDVLDETAAFDLFRQGHGSSTSAGAGLGLSLCRRIVERHDGAIEAIPSAAEGATFEIRLPAANPGERVLDATEASAVGRSELSGSGREGAAA